MAEAPRKAAVIPYRIRKKRVEVALVTTSGGKRWIVPKGSVDRGEAIREAAIREAEEEAGLLGVLSRKPLGRYLHVNGDGACHVDVYVMRVTEELEHWMEDRWRRRRWMPAPDAADLLRKELRRFVHAVERLADVRRTQSRVADAPIDEPRQRIETFPNARYARPGA